MSRDHEGWSIEAPGALSTKMLGDVIAGHAPHADLQAFLTVVQTTLSEQRSSTDPAEGLRSVIDVARHRGAHVLDGARVAIVRAARTFDAETLRRVVRVGQTQLRLDHGNESDLLLRLTAAWELSRAREGSELSPDEAALLGLFLDLARPDMRDLVDAEVRAMVRELTPRLPGLADQLVAFLTVAQVELDELTSICASELSA